MRQVDPDHVRGYEPVRLGRRDVRLTPAAAAGSIEAASSRSRSAEAYTDSARRSRTPIEAVRRSSSRRTYGSDPDRHGRTPLRWLLRVITSICLVLTPAAVGVPEHRWRHLLHRDQDQYVRTRSNLIPTARCLGSAGVSGSVGTFRHPARRRALGAAGDPARAGRGGLPSSRGSATVWRSAWATSAACEVQASLKDISDRRNALTVLVLFCQALADVIALLRRG